MKQYDITYVASADQRFIDIIVDVIFFRLTISNLWHITRLHQTLAAFHIEQDGISLIYDLYAVIFIYLYYFLFEFFSAKTLGKLVTRTRVVNKNGLKLSLKEALLRTLCRLIPFEWISFLFNKNWHDRFSKTLVIKDSALIIN